MRRTNRLFFRLKTISVVSSIRHSDLAQLKVYQCLFKSQNVGQFQNMGQQSQNVGQAQNVGQNQNVGQQGQGTEGGYFNRGPMCFNCRQYGHYQWNCPVSRLDHSRKHLN